MPDELQSPISSSPSRHLNILPSLSSHVLLSPSSSLAFELATFQAQVHAIFKLSEVILGKNIIRVIFPFYLMMMPTTMIIMMMVLIFCIKS